MNRKPALARLTAPGVRGLEAYVPGKPIEELERELGLSDVIKLASNENPLGPSPLAAAAAIRAIAQIDRYPDGTGHGLRQALAARLKVDPEQLTLGNGSNDLLVMMAEAFLTARAEAVYSEYAFLVYRLAVQATGATARVASANGADHLQPLGHDLVEMGRQIGLRTRLLFIANPNNPTGTWLSEAELRAFLSAVPSDVLVVLDEAYCEYVTLPDYPHTTSWPDEFPNLVITRTFSKIYGLAGLRIGYAISSREIADVLNRVRQPFNVNSVGLAAAEAALDDEAHLVRSREINAAGLRQLEQGMTPLGLRVGRSAGNFVLADCGRLAVPIYDALLRKGSIVRPVSGYGLPNHLRITVGSAEQNSRLLGQLAEILPLTGDGAR